MHPECGPADAVSRRDFLARSFGAVAAVTAVVAAERPAAGQNAGAAPAAGLLPTINIGPHRVTRLIAGYNPIGGFSHTTLDMARHMREYFTAQQTAQFLQHCTRQGINTWQYDHTDKTVEAIRLARDAGCPIKLICLHADRSGGASIRDVMENRPLAVVHHGGVTDGLFRGGKAEQVHDFVKRVHDAGALAGVSSHCPDHVKRMADEQWETDLFMTCFYYLTRPREEMQKASGKVPVGEPFFESDPDDMTAVVRSVKQPCLGFKILAAGMRCWSAASTEEAFRYAFANLKRTDAVIVGMYPRFADQVAENAGYARQYGGA
jgi:hypothetical protein